MFTPEELTQLGSLNNMAIQMAHAITEEGNATAFKIDVAVLAKMNDVLEGFLDDIIAIQTAP